MLNIITTFKLSDKKLIGERLLPFHKTDLLEQPQMLDKLYEVIDILIKQTHYPIASEIFLNRSSPVISASVSNKKADADKENSKPYNELLYTVK